VYCRINPSFKSVHQAVARRNSVLLDKKTRAPATNIGPPVVKPGGGGGIADSIASTGRAQGPGIASSIGQAGRALAGAGYGGTRTAGLRTAAGAPAASMARWWAALVLVAHAGGCAGSPTVIARVPVGLIAGACSKALRDILIHPIDTVKNRRQILAAEGDGGTHDDRVPGVFANPYAGIGPSLVSGIPAGALYLYIGDVLREEQHMNSGLAGAAASLVFWTVRTPGEVVKTRMQLASRTLQPAPDLRETLCAMREEEGLMALWNGYAVTLARSVLFYYY
jgi:hypothetical protein